MLMNAFAFANIEEDLKHYVNPFGRDQVVSVRTVIQFIFTIEI